MERYSAKTIDEFGRIPLHNELREKLGLFEYKAKSVVTLKPLGSILILQTKMEDEYFGSEIDDIGRLTLTKELQKTMGWQPGNKIAIYYVDDVMLILRLA